MLKVPRHQRAGLLQFGGSEQVQVAAGAQAKADEPSGARHESSIGTPAAPTQFPKLAAVARSVL